MPFDDLSQKVSFLSQRLKGLEADFSSNSANAPKILADALDSLHASIEELLVAEKVIKQQGEECIKSLQENTDYQALVHSLQMHQIELAMQNEELKRSKAETEEALSKFYDIYDFSPIGLLTLDTKGHIIEANLTGATLLGMARGSIMNKRFRNFVMPKDRRQFDEFYKKALETSAKETCELKLLKNGGS